MQEKIKLDSKSFIPLIRYSFKMKNHFSKEDAISFIKKLVEENKTASIESTSSKHYSLLIVTVLCRFTNLIQYLIDNGAELEHQDVEGKTALHHAAIINNAEIIEILVKNGANIEAEDSWGNSPLMRSLESKKSNGEAMFKLLDLGANPKKENNHKVSFLRERENLLPDGTKISSLFEEYEKSKGVTLGE